MSRTVYYPLLDQLRANRTEAGHLHPKRISDVARSSDSVELVEGASQVGRE